MKNRREGGGGGGGGGKPTPRDIGLKRVCTLTEAIHRNLSGDHVIFL